ncbi:MAG: cyclic nucleotide-binding domain-containing protein, partial [Comamonadaceae bacterium]
MVASLTASIPFDLHALIEATACNDSPDVFRPALRMQQWMLFGPYLQPLAAASGHVLIRQGGTDRTVYFVESGSLSVHFEDETRRIRIAAIHAGSAVGEGAFFSRQPRTATVQSAEPCRLWALTPLRFTELSNRQPEIALEVS